MKSVASCIGCGRTRLVNEFDLCKRCNRHSHDFLTQEDFDRSRRQREAILEAKARREAKKAAAKGGAAPGEGEAEGEETGEEGEGEGEAEGEGEDDEPEASAADDDSHK